MSAIQTRSEITGLNYHTTLDKALDEAERDKSIWKISFDSATEERIRLVKTDCGWTLENVYSIIADAIVRENDMKIK